MFDLEQALIEDFQQSLVDLISHYFGSEVVLEVDPNASVESKVAATVGFGDPYLRGSATLLSDAIRASQLGSGLAVNLADWLGELANQLVGRFKNKVAAHGRSVSLGLPVRMQCQDIQIAGVRTKTWSTQWGPQRLVVILDLEVLKEFELKTHPDATALKEGSVYLF